MNLARIKELKILVGLDDLEGIFEDPHLPNICSDLDQDKNLNDELLALKGMLYSLNKKVHNGLISNEQKTIERNQIREAILSFLKKTENIALNIQSEQNKKNKLLESYNKYQIKHLLGLWVSLFIVGVIYGFLTSKKISKNLQNLSIEEKIWIKIVSEDFLFEQSTLKPKSYDEAYEILKKKHEISKTFGTSKQYSDEYLYLFNLSDTICKENFFKSPNIDSPASNEISKKQIILTALAAYQLNSAAKVTKRIFKYGNTKTKILACILIIAGGGLGYILTYREEKIDLNYDQGSKEYKEIITNPNFWCSLGVGYDLLELAHRIKCQN